MRFPAAGDAPRFGEGVLCMLSVSSYFSVTYLAGLLPVTVLLYAVLPRRLRRWELLLASYVFFWAVSGKLVIYLWWTTLSAHYGGLWLDRLQRDCSEALRTTEQSGRKAVKRQWRARKRGVLALGAAATLGVLLVLKYGRFFAGNLNSLLELLQLSVRVEVPAFALPVGISFYTMQAVSYLFDVYWERIQAERNPGRGGEHRRRSGAGRQ